MIPSPLADTYAHVIMAAVFRQLPWRSAAASIRFAPALARAVGVRRLSGKVEVQDGVRLSYEQHGTGPHALLCIPGALGSARSDFAPQLEYFGRQESGFTVVAFDPRGYGSSRPPERSFHTEPEHFLATDGHDAHLLMKALGFTEFSVLGWSDGGVSAIILAANYQEAVRSLVVWGSNAYVSLQDLELFELTRDVKNWSQKMREPMEAMYGAAGLQKLWSDWMDGIKKLYTAREDASLCLEDLANIKCPMLVLHGEKDPICPQFHAEFLRDHVTGAELQLFPAGKHNIHLRFAQEFNAIVEEFVRRGQS